MLNPPVAGLDRRSSGTTISFLPLDKIWADERFDPSTGFLFMGDLGSYNPVADGDLLLPKVAPTFEHGRVVVARGLIGGRALATSEVFVLRTASPNDARFLAYRLRARDFISEGVASRTGVAGLKRISVGFVRDTPIDPWAWANRATVADFLDRECARIAALVDQARRLGELAEAPALNLVEARWDDFPHVRIGRRHNVQLGKKLYEDRIDHSTAKPYLRIANVYWDRFDLDDVKVMNFEGREAELYALREGDLLVCEGRGLGRSAVWSNQIDPCYFQMSLNRVRPYGADSTRWLMWCLRVLNRRGAFLGDAPGVPHVTAEQLRAANVPTPTPAEQRSLVASVDATAIRGRELLDATQLLVSLLAEYRDALITEAVTGQLDVTAASDRQMDERLHEAVEASEG
jgi:type I restriction enzyme S subunit